MYECMTLAKKLKSIYILFMRQVNFEVTPMSSKPTGKYGKNSTTRIQRKSIFNVD
jgi:hypothetical protein